MSANDPINDLCDLLREANVRVTFDRHRSIANPCYLCGTTAAPRDLVRIVTYMRPMGGDLRPGDAIIRPLCMTCREATEPMQ